MPDSVRAEPAASQSFCRVVGFGNGYWYGVGRPAGFLADSPPAGAIMVLMADPSAASGVTRKEAEVLAGLGEHLTNAEIAARMFVSELTVESHVSSLLRKLHASDRRELGRLAGRIAETSTGGSGAIGPSGTVTFLFTDVEDSTALWEQHPSLMPEVLARHDAVVQDAITGHGGRIFTTAGDGFGAAFASAPEAVGDAVDAQRSLGLESWPGDIGNDALQRRQQLRPRQRWCRLRRPDPVRGPHPDPVAATPNDSRRGLGLGLPLRRCSDDGPVAT